MCLRRAYFDVRSPELGEPPSKGDQERMRAGQEIGRMAHRLFEGVLVEAPAYDMEKAVAETQAAIESGAAAVFEATFMNDFGSVRVDVLSRDGEKWSLIEVKSSKAVKPEHLTDVAFQKAVLERSGVLVDKCFLLLIADDYIHSEGALDVDRFFRLKEVTAEVLELAASVTSQASEVSRAVSGQDAPEVVPNVHCVRDGGCGYVKHCFRDLPLHDVTTLPYIKREAVIELHVRGTRDIASIPGDVKLSDRQKLITSVVQSGVPFVSSDLSALIEGLKYPLHFVDFEAVGTAVPLYAGVAPYQAVPFQWSNHVLEESGTQRHMEFLCPGGDPRQEFARSLWEAVQGAGTVIHYASYEKSILKSLVGAGVDLAMDLLELFEDRGLDLEKVVREHVYLAEFQGKSSIKRVYPALVPEGGYRDLNVKDGDHAAAEYKRMLSAATTPHEKEKIARDLLAYCERDTLAMLEVFQALNSLARNPSSP